MFLNTLKCASRARHADCSHTHLKPACDWATRWMICAVMKICHLAGLWYRVACFWLALFAGHETYCHSAEIILTCVTQTNFCTVAISLVMSLDNHAVHRSELCMHHKIRVLQTTCVSVLFTLIVSAGARPDDVSQHFQSVVNQPLHWSNANMKKGLIWIYSHMPAFIALSDLVPTMCLWHLVKHCRAQTDVLLSSVCVWWTWQGFETTRWQYKILWVEWAAFRFHPGTNQSCWS